MKGWNQIGVIETIYEEEREFSSTSSSPSLSPSFSSSPPSLYSIVNAWSIDSGCETDVLIRVEGTCFRLHKERFISRSSYLKRHLTSLSDFTLSPPLNITASTFTTVAEFCYNRKIHLTPTNIAAVITAAELLGMKEGDINLRDVAESYFQRIVCMEGLTVLRSCMALFPEAETTSSLGSRCIEALIWENDDVDDSVLDFIVEMQLRDFQMVVCSLNGRLVNHDVLYKLVDLYLKENKHGKVTEEQKTEICNSIDCTKLSPRTLVECVQNPIMPLRFIVRAILVEHLTTRRSITEAATTTTTTTNARQHVEVQRTTLREFLQLDTTLRQNAQLKEAMNSTYSRIQSLEKELSCMKKFLQDHQAEEVKEKEKEQSNSVLNSERSASFHFVPNDENSKIQRGGRGSISSSGFVLDNMIKKNNESVRYKYNVDSSLGSCHEESVTPTKSGTSFRHRFITGLKNTFKISNSSSNLKDHQ